MASSKRVVAFYDALKCPVTYDFVVFASMAKTVANGRPLHFVFVPREDGTRSKPGKFSPEEADYRFKHIVLEAASLFGTYTICQTRSDARAYEGGETFPLGYRVDAPVFNYQMDGVVDLGVTNAAPQPSRRAMQYVRDYLGDRNPIVVTLRNSRYQVRNSNFGAWDAFAWQNDVVFVPDTDDAFIGNGNNWFSQASVNMDIRLALYHQAKLNCFTSNGCAGLLFFSDIPYLSFKAGGDGYMSKEEWDRLKIPYGTQPPFVKPNQKWVWEPDTIDVIRREVEQNLCRV